MGICVSRPRGAGRGPSEGEEYNKDPEVAIDSGEVSDSLSTVPESQSENLQNSVSIQNENSLETMVVTQHTTQIQEQVPLEEQAVQTKALVRIKKSQQQNQIQVATQEVKANKIESEMQQPTQTQPTISPQPKP